MKVHVLLPLTIFVSFALLGVIKLRKREQESTIRLSKFNEVKLRVTQNVLDDILNEKKETERLLEKTEGVQKLLEEDLNTIQDKVEDTKGYVDNCMGDKKTEIDKLVKAESDLKNLKDESDKERSSWQTEETALKQKIAERSSVCDFLKKDAQLPGNMCGTQAVGEGAKQEEPKAEATKQEEPKAEATKQEEPKGEAPKQKEPKGEAPKQEEPKGEAPKQEEPKGEAPKQEEPKGEDPKQKEPKGEAPKQEEPKGEAPKQKEPKGEAPKQEEPKGEAPKQEEPKAEDPKQEEPKAEDPKQEEPKGEAPKIK